MLLEHRAIKIRELGLDEFRYFDVARQFHRAVVGGFHAAGARQCVDVQFLLVLCVQRAEPDRQHELVALVGNLDGAQVGIAELRLLRQVHLGDEEAHVLLQITVYDGFGASRNPVAVFVQPFDQPAAFFGRQHQDIVLTDCITGFDGHAARTRIFPKLARSRKSVVGARFKGELVTYARIRVMILNEPWCRVCVEMFDQRAIGDIDLLTFDECRHRDDDGEILDVALEVVGHRDNSSVVVADKHHL